ncbi:hypothetical protein OG21DRAFT_1416887 [Imleria badia]|nr:hypothetical protein OG21DRAFT_1416887 [Imleria badia]
MICCRALSAQAQVYLVLSASFALSALQNVTVDDAVLNGAVVPQYLPSDSVWNIGNNCTGCFVKPDPSLAYNGTWHDTTYSSSNGYTQAIEFTFTGSALYIFFIIANTVSNATTLTDVDFVLDQLAVSSYTHTPSTSTDYQYNVAIYANDSLVLGEHNMMIQPVNSGNNVLILFDYLIYACVLCLVLHRPFSCILSVWIRQVRVLSHYLPQRPPPLHHHPPRLGLEHLQDQMSVLLSVVQWAELLLLFSRLHPSCVVGGIKDAMKVYLK